MVTLHIAQLLEDEGFGTIDANTNGLYWEKLPLGKQGVGIMSRGIPLSRGTRNIQAFDLYSRGSSDLQGADKLEKIKEFIDDTYVVCNLPTTPKSTKLYSNASLEVTGNIENIGLDENDRIIFRLAAEVIYNK
jgi:hypothetical protein